MAQISFSVLGTRLEELLVRLLELFEYEWIAELTF